jgi:hypothetical protein
VEELDFRRRREVCSSLKAHLSLNITGRKEEEGESKDDTGT